MKTAKPASLNLKLKKRKGATWGKFSKISHRKSPKAPLFSELPADLVTGRGIHGVGRVEASVVWGIGMERVAMTFRNSCRSKKNHRNLTI